MKKSAQIALAIGFALSAPFIRAQAVQPDAATAATDAESASSVVPPDEQPTKEQVAKLFETMHLREQYSSTMKTFPAMIEQQLRQQEKQVTANQPARTKLTPQQQTALDQLQNRFFEKALNVYTVDEMLDDMTKIYQRHFTSDDVNAYIAFYFTPAGQHFLQVSPVIMKEYAPVVMQRIQERSKDLSADYSKELLDLMKSNRSPAAKPPMPAPK